MTKNPEVVFPEFSARVSIVKKPDVSSETNDIGRELESGSRVSIVKDSEYITTYEMGREIVPGSRVSMTKCPEIASETEEIGCV